MTDDLGVLPGGNRRIDRLLGEQHDLRAASLPELRRLRDDAEQEETDASFVRRLLQGRIDIVEAELRHRRGEGGSLADPKELARILADDTPPAAPRGMGRHTAVEPSRADSHRRHVEALTADVDLSDVTARTDEELQRALEAYRAEEQRISVSRRALQQLMDGCQAEITRRYRDGEADPSALLPADEPSA